MEQDSTDVHIAKRQLQFLNVAIAHARLTLEQVVSSCLRSRREVIMLIDLAPRTLPLCVDKARRRARVIEIVDEYTRILSETAEIWGLE